MTPLAFTLIAFGISLGAGFLGSLLGLGGGIIVIPALTLWLHIDIRYAIGASIVSVIATSSGAATTYVRQRLANLRVAMVLELATVLGAISGAYLAGQLAGRWLYLIFAVIMIYSAGMMFRRTSDVPAVRRAPWADHLKLHSSYHDDKLGHEVLYRVAGTRIGLVLMYLAGAISGLLGIGSGVLKVPAMDLAMGLPIKVSTATSNLMIGVTAAASAGVYFVRGDIDPFVAAPVALGVMIGAYAGSRVMGRIPAATLRMVFVVVVLVVASQMLWKGIHL